jgi:toxin-antitoxin system PIN domain toxin
MKCLDTGVLVYAADTASPFHQRAKELLEQSIAGKWAACVCEQSLWELAQILSSDRFVSKPLPSAAAWKLVDKLWRYPQPVILNSDEVIMRRAFKLMEKYASLRSRFAEAHFAATMIAHDVKVLVTADSQTFSVVRELDLENPFETLFA